MVEPSNTQAEADAIAVDLADESDSILESDNASSTASLTSSVLAFRKINGRTYQNFRTSVEYWAPNDERQNEGLDINHQMMLMMNDNKLYRSSIGTSPQRVLDVGTGTGIWAVDFADEHPSAEVIGTDVSPIQPTWVPPNVKFELDDAKAIPWPYPDNHFDLVHMRLLTGSISDWVAVYKEILRVLKPGGWFEHTEYDCDFASDDESQPPGAALGRWGALFTEAGERVGQRFDVAKDQRLLKWMKEAGFTAIKEHPFKLPLGSWPKDPKMKEIGNFNLVMTDRSLEGFALYLFTQVLGWSVEETHVYIAQARKELRNKSIHGYYAGITVCGQKPKKE